MSVQKMSETVESSHKYIPYDEYAPYVYIPHDQQQMEVLRHRIDHQAVLLADLLGRVLVIEQRHDFEDAHED